MFKSDKTLIFDLDGTIYQNTVFYQDYIHNMVADTEFESWEKDLLCLSGQIFSGKLLHMNRFYRPEKLNADSVSQLALLMEGQLCPDLSYTQALCEGDIMYLGDAWAVLAFVGRSLGCLDEERSDLVYFQTRRCMEQAGMSGSARLRSSLLALRERCRIVLMSNSYPQTVDEFLRQLGFSDIFPIICSSACKPRKMLESLEKADPAILERPELLISIGDNAFNDLMPIAQLGGKTVWLNPFTGIDCPDCDLMLSTLDDLAEYLDGI